MNFLKQGLSGVLFSAMHVFASPAQAHLLKVFVYAEENVLHGYAYFSGGTAASGAKITIQNKQGQAIANVTPNDAGEFTYQAIDTADYRVIADTLDGHQAEWRITASELSEVKKDVETGDNGNTVPVNQGTDNQSTGQGMGVGIDMTLLAAMVEKAVARQVGPLRAELHINAEQARFSDVLGGVGFIFGLAGIAMWWRSKQ